MNGEEKWRLHGKNKKIFLEGLKKYQARGIPILIDGVEAKSEQLEKILETDENGGFYMGDYIWERESASANMFSTPSAVCEPSPIYHIFPEPGTCRIRLKEIRFDKVYH